MIALYRPGDSPIHRLPAGVKLLALALAGTGLMLVSAPSALAAALAAALALYPAARLPLRDAVATLRPLLSILAILFLLQGLLVSWEAGAALALRFCALILAAALVTLTTPASAMIDAVARALAPLRPLGVAPERVALALSLAIRFVPVLAATASAIREAQAARGLGSSPLALAVPLIVRTLATAEAAAEAIEARGGIEDDA
ncbi:energy-coupling factor transporter transmembrane protein EcfT [Salinarimonas sp.]|uniref:energy-coupling factor transporter transmembrane component T family protein n=1 Tax=Salinarimonas sp. TaxID=2766526 RepID=UPI0032D96C06